MIDEDFFSIIQKIRGGSKPNRQIKVVFKEKSIQQNPVTAISLLRLNLRCIAVVQLHAAGMKKKRDY